jgi:hypothetical protein
MAQKSGKIGLKSDSFRKGTPGEPPVPFLAAMCATRHVERSRDISR